MPESMTDRCTKSHEYIFLLTKSAKYYYDAEAIKEPGSNNHVTVARNSRADKGFVGSSALYGEEYGQSGNGGVGRKPGQTRNKRSVWNVATHPFPEAHFATFPPKLIEPCILAGTSEKGCCAECGSPWVRIIEKVVPELRDVKSDYPGEHTLATKKYKHGESGTESKTIGWRSTCVCLGPPLGKHPVPCTVLDPFGGSMTTAIVAYKHGRKFVMVELSKTYIERALTISWT